MDHYKVARMPGFDWSVTRHPAIQLVIEQGRRLPSTSIVVPAIGNKPAVVFDQRMEGGFLIQPPAGFFLCINPASFEEICVLNCENLDAVLFGNLLVTITIFPIEAFFHHDVSGINKAG